MLKTLKNINQINQDMLAFVKVIHCLYNYLLQQLTYIIYIFHLKFLFTINALFKSLKYQLYLSQFSVRKIYEISPPLSKNHIKKTKTTTTTSSILMEILVSLFNNSDEASSLYIFTIF